MPRRRRKEERGGEERREKGNEKAAKFKSLKCLFEERDTKIYRLCFMPAWRCVLI